MSDVEVGQRIEQLRRRKGLTREALAQLAGVSASLVKSVETGRRNLTLSTAQRLAPVLGVRDLGEIYGPQVQLTLDLAPMAEGMPEVRRAVTAWHLRVTGEPASPDYLHGALDAAWRTWHTSKHQRSDLAGVLPGLVDAGEHAVRLLDGDDRRRALALLSEIYHLVQAWIAWRSDRELMYLIIDRGMRYAVDSGDPITIAGAVFYCAHVWRAIGRSDEALDQLAEARHLVNDDAGDNPGERHLTALIDLWLCSALTRARVRDQAAWADWEHARSLAERLPDGYAHPWTRAGREVVDLYAVQLATELGDEAEAARRSRELDPATIPSVERRARHFIELARTSTASPVAIVHFLLQAVDASPDTVASSPTAVDLIRRLRGDAPAAIRTQVERLAEVAG
jgi:transcriptional regulator with XRE-family HTH domain